MSKPPLPERAAAHASPAWRRQLAAFAALVALALITWPLLAEPATRGFRALASAALAPVTFGSGGHVDIGPAAAGTTPTAEHDASWDARLTLRIDGVSRAHSIVVNPRRLFFLPLCFFLACVAATPWSRGRQLRVAGAGAVALLLLAFVSIWVTAAWLFARVPGLVYTLAPWQAAALHVAYEALVTQPANKFIFPLVLLLGTFALLRSYDRERASEAAVGTTPPRAELAAPRVARRVKAAARGGRRRR